MSDTIYTLGIDIVGMTDNINSIVNTWAKKYNGISFVSTDDEDKIQYGYSNCVGPKCLVCYEGETTYGDDSVSDVTAYVKRDFNIIIERMKTDSEPRNLDLTKTIGAAVPFYTLAEQLRDTVRAILLPAGCFNPVQFHEMRGEKTEDGYGIRKFVISISILCQIPRILVTPPQINVTSSYLDY